MRKYQKEKDAIRKFYARRGSKINRITIHQKSGVVQYDVSFAEGTGPLGLTCVTLNYNTVLALGDL